MSSFPDKLEALIIDVHISDDVLKVVLADAREISVPMAWFPRLFNATREQRQNWRLIGKGIGIHWADIDEDISVDGLLRSN